MTDLTYDTFLRLAQAISPRHTETEDLAQEGYLRALTVLDRFPTKGDGYAYVAGKKRILDLLGREQLAWTSSERRHGNPLDVYRAQRVLHFQQDEADSSDPAVWHGHLMVSHDEDYDIGFEDPCLSSAVSGLSELEKQVVYRHIWLDQPTSRFHAPSDMDVELGVGVGMSARIWQRARRSLEKAIVDCRGVEKRLVEV